MSTYSVLSSPNALNLRQRRPSQRIIAIGDSLVYGFGDSVGGGWVERLRCQWMSPDASGHALYNLGIRGNCVAQVIERLENEFLNRGELKNHLPDLIILSVGVNDTPRVGRLNGKSLTPFETFQPRIAELLKLARELCPVLFVGMVPVDESKMPFLDCLYYNHADQYRYKEATKQACQTYGVPYLDVFDLWMERSQSWRHSQLSIDGLHPNATGYQMLLQDILNWEPFSQAV